MNRVKMFAIVVAIVLIVGGAWWVWNTNYRVDTSDGNLSPSEEKIILREVNARYQAPQEKPGMAIITDAATLINEQSFYQGAQNGDVLLVYPKAAKAVIYSVHDHQLVNIGPVMKAPKQ